MVIPWVGYSLAELIKRVEPTGDAKYLQFVTLADKAQMPGLRSPVLDWPYVEGLRMDEAMQPLAMLAFGTLVGAAFATLLFCLTVVSLPMLLEREVDFVTAMLTSFALVRENPLVMLGWGALIAACLFLGMLPGFLGLFLVLPLFGHASWHLYRRAIT